MFFEKIVNTPGSFLEVNSNTSDCLSYLRSIQIQDVIFIIADEDAETALGIPEEQPEEQPKVAHCHCNI